VVTATNMGPEAATLWLLPTLWFRNTWAWGAGEESAWGEPQIKLVDGGVIAAHATLGRYHLAARDAAEWIFTDNETNAARLFGAANRTPHVKDAFHDWLVHGDRTALNPARIGTKAAAVHRLDLAAGRRAVVALRLRAHGDQPAGRPFGRGFDAVFRRRISEADAFHADIAGHLAPEARAVVRQAAAGLVWSQQFYFFDVPRWVAGDPAQPAPPAHRDHPNHDWPHLHARDILAVPDAWEFPWFAVWDTAFQMIAHALVDPDFAKDQIVRFLRERYQHPNGQLAAYEFNFADVNPPVHAGACRRIYEMTGRTDRYFLARVFHKLALNFTWWVNRADRTGRHLFSGDFLGLDNIGVFDRSKPLPVAGHLEQADGTAWMAHFAAEMLAIAVELAGHDPAYEDMARKFFEHYLAIVTAVNTLDGTGLWDEEDGFYYDHLHVDGRMVPLKCRSMVGLVPLFAVETFDRDMLERLPGFRRRIEWFARRRPVRGQLQLAGADLAADELHADRVAAAVRRVLRRHACGGVSDRLGSPVHACRGGRRDRPPGVRHLPARRKRPPALPRGRAAVCRRIRLAGAGALPRVFRRRHRPWLWRRPPDRLVGPRGESARRAARRLGPMKKILSSEPRGMPEMQAASGTGRRRDVSGVVRLFRQDHGVDRIFHGPQSRGSACRTTNHGRRRRQASAGRRRH